jgi:cyanophycinase
MIPLLTTSSTVNFNKLKPLILTAILFTTSILLTRPAIAFKHYLQGNPKNVNPDLAGAVYNLGGGGTDVDAAIQWMINQARGCTRCSTKVDVVIIRASGDDSYNEPIYAMNGVNSVQTLIIDSRTDANSASAVERVQNAEVIFFAGGDQCRYVNFFKNTKLENAVQSVSTRGGAVGGTSAGAMIQSNFVYNACGKAVESRDALTDPYRDIEFTYNFFPWSNLKNTIVDTHFDKRDRMGRLMVFIARQLQDRKAKSVIGIGVSEGTSVVVDRNGTAKVMGKGSAYFVLGDHLPKVCEPGRSLDYRDYKIWKINSGGSFSLRNHPQRGYYLRSVNRGRIDSNPY